MHKSPSTHSDSASGDTMIQPGSWVGVFGGGQLGRMFTHAAQRLGYHVAVWEPEPNCPAGLVSDRQFQIASLEDQPKALREFSHLCRAVTLEFENIDARLLRSAAEHCLVRPGAEFLEICQDRVREKSSLSAAGFPTTPFRHVRNQGDLDRALIELGLPAIAKTATSGYDGKGQVKIHDISQSVSAWQSLNSDHVIAEKCIDFSAEVSMITARNARGQIECYPLFENEHSQHILDITRCPAQPQFAKLQAAAEEICRGIAETFSVEGLFCVEFFVDGSDQLLINEIAPRPHNSGHLTIEAFDCSQFEQQLRALCNLPLASPELIRPAAMANLLGDLWQSGTPNWSVALEQPHVHLHLYGKSAPRIGRKMGHLTVLDSQASLAAERARQIRSDFATPVQLNAKQSATSATTRT
jgi:5-(carboxyamino)imidazole ribonucleotide synthase